MNEQDWSPFAEGPPPPPRPAPSPGRASVPMPTAASRPSPYPKTDHPPHDQTAPLRPPSLARKQDPPGLIPAPDATAILPQIPSDPLPAPHGGDSPARKKRTVKRHRDGQSGAKTRRTVRGIGEVFITFGVIVLLYAAYEIFGVTAEINNQQEHLASDLDVMWRTNETLEEGVDGAPVPELGDAFARMWAPAIRPEPWILVEGTELSDIEYAPGRYLDGAYPGQQGNFTLAGHNVPAIFQKIRDLDSGDKVVVETMEYFYVYEVRRHVVVDETQVDITEPVPGDPGAMPDEDDYWMTLFTCHPLWDNYERYVVYTQLVETYERDPDGELPAEAIDAEE